MTAAELKAIRARAEDEKTGRYNHALDVRADRALLLAEVDRLREALRDLWQWQSTIQDVPPDAVADAVRTALGDER